MIPAAPAPRAPRRPVRRPRTEPFTFVCTGCEAVEHRPTPRLPEGWRTLEAQNDIQAWCADCPCDDLGCAEHLQ